MVAVVFGVLSLVGKFDDTFARLAKNGVLASRLRLAFGSSLLILSAALLLATVPPVRVIHETMRLI